PHLRYGQGIPGVTQGRAAGIIETRGLVGVVDAIGMLERSPSWTAADDRGMAQWFSAYLGWLRSSAIGKGERNAHNNHGTWYDAQVASLALFTGDSGLARSTLATAGTRRIASQVTADGRQPYELARTRSLAYSVMNLAGLCRLRSEEHTSELQSLAYLVCRLLLDPPATRLSPLSLPDALPISTRESPPWPCSPATRDWRAPPSQRPEPAALPRRSPPTAASRTSWPGRARSPTA